ncbi:MAG: OmpA family protein [Nitrospinaceae bacterium]|jgi:chemotaxis protein MotB|nr:OmpA family protein [Nitrospinaceae bacterium]MBT3435406.1 OmpA family protein [Nitrospinaceae bacterium]MBT4430628.1 OmpA family protein [Nitrospinaceae bacterium]MBT5367921.1 OmpA family protein [Nitrospinaceae bacterium]MBT5946496.1 OmpA family protein [Nitrospinaceae bacterium]
MGNRTLSLLIIAVLLAGGGFLAYQSHERSLALEAANSTLASSKAALNRERGSTVQLKAKLSSTTTRLAEVEKTHNAALANEREAGKQATEALGKKVADLEQEKKAALAEINSTLLETRKEHDALKEKSKKSEKVLAELRDALAGTSSSAAENRRTLTRTRQLLATAEEKRRATLARAKSVSQKAQEEAKRAQMLEASLAELTRKYNNQIISLHKTKETLQIQIVDKLLFDMGSAELRDAGLEALDRIASALKNQRNRNIRVEGHTDNLPIRGGLARRYPSNWELSAARAIAVVRRLEAQGIAPARLSATGYAFHHPVADNATAEGRARNRRIEILMNRKQGKN